MMMTIIMITRNIFTIVSSSDCTYTRIPVYIPAQLMHNCRLSAMCGTVKPRV
jgi:hypothetical protein